MRSGPNNRRSRGRGNSGRGNRPQRNNNFDSSGPDTKVRGTAQQQKDNVQTLGGLSGDAQDEEVDPVEPIGGGSSGGGSSSVRVAAQQQKHNKPESRNVKSQLRSMHPVHLPRTRMRIPSTMS